jgi:hypothetical protein
MLSDVAIAPSERAADGSSLCRSGAGSRQLDTSSSDQLGAFDSCFLATQRVASWWPVDSVAHSIALGVYNDFVGSVEAEETLSLPSQDFVQIWIVVCGDNDKSNINQL